MAESVLVLAENGSRIVHDLPLPEGLASRVEKGEAKVLGSCDADGNLFAVEPEPDPEAESVGEEPAARLRMPAQSQDAAGDSPDDDGPSAGPVKRGRRKATDTSGE